MRKIKIFSTTGKAVNKEEVEKIDNQFKNEPHGKTFPIVSPMILPLSGRAFHLPSFHLPLALAGISGRTFLPSFHHHLPLPRSAMTMKLVGKAVIGLQVNNF